MTKTTTFVPTIAPKGAVISPTHDTPESVDPLLVTILAWPRMHNTPSELSFRTWMRNKITDTMPPVAAMKILAEGVTYVNIPSKLGAQSTTLFSSHVDTCDDVVSGFLIPGPVGHKTKKVPDTLVHKLKMLTYDSNFGTIALDPKNTVGSCLGADDGIGVWIMLKMIEAGIPGGYMFHTGEECGAHGSRGVLKTHTDILQLYDVALAFDRPRYSEVITHQGGQECCSQKFGTALSAALNALGMGYSNSALGTFTDTRVYRGVIAECVNLGVGYESQHTHNETQDYPHAFALLAALLKLDWDSLPVDRDPLKADPVYKRDTPYKSPYGKQWDRVGAKGGKNFGLFDDDYDFSDDNAYWKNSKLAAVKPSAVIPVQAPAPFLSVYDELKDTMMDDLEQWVCDDGESAAASMASLIMEIGRLRSDLQQLKTLLGRGVA